MSDLEDLDHEPENLNIEEELAAPAGNPAKSAGGAPAKSDALFKAAVIAIVVVGGGAYFMMHHGRTKQAGTAFPPSTSQQAFDSHAAMPPAMPVQKDNKEANANASGWNVPLPVSAPPAPAAAPAAAVPAPEPHDLLPAAIPPAGQEAHGGKIPSTPQIVNEAPPSSAQLTNTMATPPPPTEAAIPGMPPGMPAGMMPPTPPSASSAPLPPGFPPVAGAADASKQPPFQPVQTPSAAKTGEPMPAAPVPGVDKMDFNNPAAAIAAANNLPPPDATPNAMPPGVAPAPGIPAPAGIPAAPAAGLPPVTAPAAPKAAELNKPATPDTETAKVQQLQKKIDDLEKIISQLQQAAVVKEDAADKSASPREHSVTAHHRAAHERVHHAAPVRWVLKAAKPGVAWVAKKGSDDLQMVEAGDSLAGIGHITDISQDSSGAWIVRGTKGRISQ